MKLGVFTVLYQMHPFEKMLDIVKEKGLDAIEIGTGYYPGNVHCNYEELLNDENKLKSFAREIEKRGLFISALSCHGNPLHPNKDIAQKSHSAWYNTVLLAEKLGVDCINLFSGCPGDSENSNYPNWVTCAWPPDFQDLLKWQWEEKVIPYWKDQAKFAKKHRIKKLAYEMHPGFVVYNPETLMKLRNAVGEIVGANFDPSHLIWQGIDPIEAIRYLGKNSAIYHVHAKDVYIDKYNKSINGVLDTKPYTDTLDRSWTFRSVGYGNSYDYWKGLISMFANVGYDYVISIEHEDILMSVDEGFIKAVNFLKQCIIKDKLAKPWWT